MGTLEVQVGPKSTAGHLEFGAHLRGREQRGRLLSRRLSVGEQHELEILTSQKLPLKSCPGNQVTQKWQAHHTPK